MDINKKSETENKTEKQEPNKNESSKDESNQTTSKKEPEFDLELIRIIEEVYEYFSFDSQEKIDDFKYRSIHKDVSVEKFAEMMKCLGQYPTAEFLKHIKTEYPKRISKDEFVEEMLPYMNMA